MISSLHVTKVMMLIMIMTSMPLPSDTFHHDLFVCLSRRSSARDSANHAILGSENA